MQFEMLGVYAREKQKGGKIAVISDSNVAPYYMEDCLEGLEFTGYEAEGFVVPAGERSKVGERYLMLLEKLADSGMSKGDGIAALGGGMVIDLAGYVAATYMGGIKLYLVPTTLMSMLDYSLSGRFQIDMGAGRNIAEIRYQPEMVLRDPRILKSLPGSMMREGISEIIKYGASSDAELFEAVEHAVSAKSFDIDLPVMIERCAAIRMSGENSYGTTIGDAIERLSGYSIGHGFALAKGMDITSKLAVNMGWCSQDVYDRIHILLSDLRYDLSPGCDLSDIIGELTKTAGRGAKSIQIAAPTEIGISEEYQISLT